jgi:hypothetical protein
MAEVTKRTLLELQAGELQAKYQSLRLEYPHEGNPIVQGTIRFQAEYQGKEARGEYDIKIVIPENYPDDVPSVFETGGQLPSDFHKYKNSRLCLGAPVAVRKTFLASPTLLTFVENLVIPYLFSHAYSAEHGEMPFGELAHGISGILDFYNDLFQTETRSTLLLLRTLADGAERYKHYLPCPCGGAASLGQCHGPQLEGLWAVMRAQDYTQELTAIVAAFKRACPDIDFGKYLPYKTQKKRNAKLRRGGWHAGTGRLPEGDDAKRKEPSAAPANERGAALRDLIRQQFSASNPP